ncbi:biotin transporter BioY [Actinotalea sp.]|uniref:biotin transporter BioY n=1 Tax=Actinotalea sp. TaxID=1872145 RepID=UPI002C7E37AE|nr:biotin transporter BioY [Actinotalea sp.]HQY33585.1 biotin transporter BioY [Actinotalea sp.]HRA50821.1 biotin transporter BioY [Actinotalea sp.]
MSAAPPDPTASADDAARSAGTRSAATDLSLIGTGAALLAVCSLVAVPVGPAGAPITLQTFAVLLAGAVLGARRGALAVLLYLAVGFAGLPVFAEGAGGPATFAKVTLGYLLAFPVAAWVTGAVVERFGRRAGGPRTAVIVAAGVLGSLVVYAIGVPVLAARIGVSLAEGLAINAAFLPFDAVKVVLAAVVASAVHRAFPDLLPR